MQEQPEFRNLLAALAADLQSVGIAWQIGVKQPRPVALLKQFGESGIDLELYVWIGDPESGTANLRSDLYLSLWKQFRAHRIDIPFPQREVRIVQGALPAAPPA
jgi:small-conductance mechanosensitive channel